MITVKVKVELVTSRWWDILGKSGKSRPGRVGPLSAPGETRRVPSRRQGEGGGSFSSCGAQGAREGGRCEPEGAAQGSPACAAAERPGPCGLPRAGLGQRCQPAPGPLRPPPSAPSPSSASFVPPGRGEEDRRQERPPPYSIESWNHAGRVKEAAVRSSSPTVNPEQP